MRLQVTSVPRVRETDGLDHWDGLGDKEGRSLVFLASLSSLEVSGVFGGTPSESQARAGNDRGKVNTLGQSDLNEILESLLSAGKRMLADHGGFFPFAASMDQAGDVEPVETQDEGDGMLPQDILESLLGTLSEKAWRGELRAAGICADVLIVPPGETEKTDALSVRLEHANGESFNVFVSYRLIARRKHEYGVPFAGQLDREIFGDSV